MILSIDIETHGAVKRFADGRRAPEQHVFHPIRSLLQHGVQYRDQIVTCSVTECSSRHPLPVQPVGEREVVSWLPFLTTLEPGSTRVFNLSDRLHRQHLAAWLSSATLLLGMNLAFDVLWLRAQPDFRAYLHEDGPMLLDAAVLNYLHSEMRPERSLKNLVGLFNIDLYDEEDSLKKGHRYRSPSDPKLIDYNARDSHNTALLCSHLARMIQRDHAGTAKCSSWCIQHYSDTLWLCIGLGEAGVPFSSSRLLSLEAECEAAITRCRDTALAKFSLPLDGPGSQAPQQAFIDSLASTIDSLRPGQPSILSDKRVAFTDKTKKLSTRDINREIFSMALPADHPLQEAITLWDDFKESQKLVSTYTFPLLRGPRTPKKVFAAKSVILNGRAYPTWFPVPSPTKDGGGDSGGTEQARITCKNPAVQTLPGVVKDCILPSDPRGSILWIDLSQIELRVAALLSGERTLIDAFIAGTDLHTERAIQVFGRDELIRKYGPNFLKDASFKNLERQCGKHGNFTDLNLGGAETLQKTILKKGGVAVPISFCEEIVRKRPVTRPQLWDWQMSLIEQVKRDHVLHLPICGISRYFSGADGVIDETYRSTIVNCPIQSWAGILMREFQIRLQRAICPLWLTRFRARQFVNIYDATAFDCKPGVAPRLLPIIQSCFDSLSQPGGIWHRLESHLARTCPIAFDIKEVTHAT